MPPGHTVNPFLCPGWSLEMNGTWFPWSGYFYGGGKLVGHKGGVALYEGPELFKQAYRYVVDKVRARGADNIMWGFHINHYALSQHLSQRYSMILRQDIPGSRPLYIGTNAERNKDGSYSNLHVNSSPEALDA
ncbi:MAG: hypothetical protein ACUVQV_03720, partial [Dissulfurimicrobium sp.]